MTAEAARRQLKSLASPTAASVGDPVLQDGAGAVRRGRHVHRDQSADAPHGVPSVPGVAAGRNPKRS